MFTPNDSQKRVIDCRDTLCVTAGAGSGKTGTLVETIASRLAESYPTAGRLSVQNILALTFTDKAAAELRGRLAEAFESRAGAAAGPDEAEFWRQEAGRLDRADIGTIHSYALRLVKENAIGLGLGTAVDVESDDSAQGRDFDNAFVDWLDEGDADLAWLLGRLPLWRVKDILRYCAEKAGSWGLLCLQGDRAPVAQAFAGSLKAVREAVAQASAVVRGGALDKLKNFGAISAAVGALAEETAITADAAGEGLAPDIARWQGLLGGSWGKKEGLEAKHALMESLAALRGANDALIAAPYKERLLRLANQLPGRLNGLKRRRGTINYDDILILARRLLATNPQARQREIAKYRLVMIDEFQDTNRLQADLLAYLLLDPEDGGRYPDGGDLWRELPWERTAPRLIVFGDLKQSIYRFRGAEVELMANLRERLGQGGGQALALDSNYRSQPGLIEFFNGFFQSQLAGFTEQDRQAASRGRLYEGPQVALLSPPPGLATGLVGDKAAAQAEALARYLGELFSGQRGVLVADGQGGGRPPRPGDVAILMRHKKRMLAFKESLLAAGWECQTVADTSPFNFSEVKALVAAYKFLAGVDEELNLAGALRSPLGPVPDEAVFRLCWPEGVRRVSLAGYFKGGRALPAGLGNQALAELQALFTRLDQLMGRVRPVEILERLAEERHLLASALLEADGEDRAAALTAFLAASRGLEPAEAVRGLDDLAANWANGFGGEETFSRGAIKLLTVHGAKGLEFPVVVVPEADRPARGGGRETALISREGALSFFFNDARGRQVKPADFIAQSEGEKEAQGQEENRLLYVAATRAQDHLVFVGWPKEKPSENPSWFEKVDCCPETRHLVARVRYEAPGKPAAVAGKPVAAAAMPTGAAPAEAGPWPADLLAPVALNSHALSSTGLCEFIVSPDKFYYERYLGIKGGLGPWPEGPFLTAAEGEAPETRPKGRLAASASGLLFHAVLERLDPAVPDVAAIIGKETAAMPIKPSPAEAKRLAGQLGAFLDGDLGRQWREARQAGLPEYREMAFNLSIPGPGTGGALRVTGRVDLFHGLAGGGGRVIDYKLSPWEACDAPKLETYELQVRLYAQALRAAGFTGPLSAFLYFAGGQTPHAHEVNLAAPDPFAPYLPKLHALWPRLMALRPLGTERPGRLPGQASQL